MSTPLECGERVVEGGTAARWEDVSDKEGSRRDIRKYSEAHFTSPNPAPMALFLRTVAALALLVVIQAACPNQCR
jgi:hypothetical protein